MFLPAMMDGALQYFFGINSSNTRRIVTGLLAGLGICLIGN